MILTDSNTQEKPHFKGWNNIKEGYYTKTTLSRDYGLKPINEDDFDATLKAYAAGRWKDFVLYHIDNTIPIKKRKIQLLEQSDKNLAESLYIINKSAKKSRDTKQENYYSRNFQIVNASKTRQNKLYDLKDEVISKLLKENRINIVGYHTQKSYDDNINYLMFLEMKGFTFHLPVCKSQTQNLEQLGVIDIIPAEKTKTTSINFSKQKNY